MILLYFNLKVKLNPSFEAWQANPSRGQYRSRITASGLGYIAVTGYNR